MVWYYRDKERKGDIQMDSIRRFKNLMSILMLYASNLIIHDRVDVPKKFVITDTNKRITGTVFPKLTTSEK